MLEYLSDLGYASIGMNGYISLSFQEINSYIQSIGVNLDAWECVWLKELSTAYVNESYDKSPTKFAPYSSGKYTFSSDDAILAAFSGLGKSK